jgi:hypothetical protein
MEMLSYGDDESENENEEGDGVIVNQKIGYDRHELERRWADPEESESNDEEDSAVRKKNQAPEENPHNQPKTLISLADLLEKDIPIPSFINRNQVEEFQVTPTTTESVF